MNEGQKALDMLMPPISCNGYQTGAVKLDIPESLEWYLMTVLQLENRYSFARVKDIASELGYKKSSVVGGLKKLEAMGLIVYPPYQPINLTEEGHRLAEYIGWRMGILVRFFMTVLQLEPIEAKRSAKLIGHALDSKVIERMRRFMSETYTTIAEPFDVLG